MWKEKENEEQGSLGMCVDGVVRFAETVNTREKVVLMRRKC